MLIHVLSRSSLLFSAFSFYSKCDITYIITIINHLTTIATSIFGTPHTTLTNRTPTLRSASAASSDQCVSPCTIVVCRSFCYHTHQPHHPFHSIHPPKRSDHKTTKHSCRLPSARRIIRTNHSHIRTHAHTLRHRDTWTVPERSAAGVARRAAMPRIRHWIRLLER